MAVGTDMDALLETLNAKLREWKPETAAEMRERVSEIMSPADQDGLDLLRSRAVEQEVLRTIDDSDGSARISGHRPLLYLRHRLCRRA